MLFMIAKQIIPAVGCNDAIGIDPVFANAAVIPPAWLGFLSVIVFQILKLDHFLFPDGFVQNLQRVKKLRIGIPDLFHRDHVFMRGLKLCTSQ